MMTNFERHIFNPLEAMNNLFPKMNMDHITYDESLTKGDYYIIRQIGHDGTYAFTMEMAEDAFLPLLRKISYCKSKEPDWEKLKDIKYTVGRGWHSKVFGKIFLKCSSMHKYPGMRERIRFPVVVNYIY